MFDVPTFETPAPIHPGREHSSRQYSIFLFGASRDSLSCILVSVPSVKTYWPRIRERLESFKDLKDGWADGVQHPDKWGEGYGKAPATEGLDWLAYQLARYYHGNLPKPHLYPTPEGGVQIEWHIGPFEADLVVDLDAQAGVWGCTNIKTHEDWEEFLGFDESGSDWLWLAEKLQQLQAQAT